MSAFRVKIIIMLFYLVIGKRQIFAYAQHRQNQNQNQTLSLMLEEPALCVPSGVGRLEYVLGGNELRIYRELSRYYNLNDQHQQQNFTDDSVGSQQQNKKDEDYYENVRKKSDESFELERNLELPAPTKISVLVMSWYPPILKLTWLLDEFGNNKEAEDAFSYVASLVSELNVDTNNGGVGKVSDEFDFEVAVDKLETGAISTPDASILNKTLPKAKLNYWRQVAARRKVLLESLSCFQVTYNVINSRFRTTEEYPSYLRSVLLERLAPATEYSLQVAAVYLNRRVALSETVAFVSPTDNESRRFRENSYRPIHRYPDRRPEARVGLAQVRNEELTIVALVLVFWVGTICLFFNKWGKIRMLEPYQPAYRETQPAASAFAHHHGAVLSSSTSGLKMAASFCAGSGSACLARGAAGVGAGAGAGGGSNGNYRNSASAPSANKLAQGDTSDSIAALVRARATQPAKLSVTALDAATSATACVAANHHAASETTTPLPPASAINTATPGDDQTIAADAQDKSPRNVLLLATRRFETIAGSSPQTIRRQAATTTDPTPPVSVSERSSLRFQSRALALARATNLWAPPGGAAHARSAAIPPAGAVRQTMAESVESRLSVYERTKAKLESAQRSLAAANSFELAPGASLLRAAGAVSPVVGRSLVGSLPSSPPLPVARSHFHQQPFLYQPQAQTQIQPRVQQSHQYQRHQMQRSRFGGLRSPQATTKSLDAGPIMPHAIGPGPGSSRWQTARAASSEAAGVGGVGGGGGRQSAVRRHLFMSRSHQHQHIATSASSQTLATSGTATTTTAPHHHHQKVLKHTSKMRNLSNESSGSRVSEQISVLVVSATEPGSEQSLAEKHHILIEPPSPPSRCSTGKFGNGAEVGGFKKASKAQQADQDLDTSIESMEPFQEPIDGCDYDNDGASAAPSAGSDEPFARLAEECELRREWRRQSDFGRALASAFCDVEPRRFQGASTAPPPPTTAAQQQQQQKQAATVNISEAEDQLSALGSERRRMRSLVVVSPAGREHRNSFATLRALNAKKSKSAEDVAHLSSFLVQLWARRERNALLQSASQSQQALGAAARPGAGTAGASNARNAFSVLQLCGRWQ